MISVDVIISKLVFSTESNFFVKDVFLKKAFGTVENIWEATLVFEKKVWRKLLYTLPNFTILLALAQGAGGNMSMLIFAHIHFAQHMLVLFPDQEMYFMP